MERRTRRVQCKCAATRPTEVGEVLRWIENYQDEHDGHLPSQLEIIDKLKSYETPLRT